MMLPLIYHPIYSDLVLPDGHRYPIHKYQLLYQAILAKLETNRCWQNSFRFVQPKALSVEQVKLVHDVDYVDALVSGRLPEAKMRRIGFPWSEALIQRTLCSAGGTCKTVEMALENQVAIHLSGGYHHAHADFGSGFCLFNDLALAAHYALSVDGIDKVLIIDSDVHHGDGTAALCQQHHDIITVSFHCEKNFPARKPDSNIDIGLPREAEDDEFLESFTTVVEMAVNLYQPDFILYDAGVDIHCDDELGYLNVTSAGIYRRDRFMFELAQRKSLPIASVIGGGYRSNHADLIPLHLQLVQAAKEVFYDEENNVE